MRLARPDDALEPVCGDHSRSLTNDEPRARTEAINVGNQPSSKGLETNSAVCLHFSESISPSHDSSQDHRSPLCTCACAAVTSRCPCSWKLPLDSMLSNIPAADLDRVLGRTAGRDLAAGVLVSWDDLA